MPLTILILSKSDVSVGYLSRALVPYPLVVCRNRDELLQNIAGADVVIAQNKGFTFHTIDQEVLVNARRLRLIQHFGVQWDITDIEEAARRGIPVATTPGANTLSVAEHAFHLLLCIMKRAHLAQESIRAGTMGELVGVELAGKTLAIIGYGKIGKMVGRMARGFSMRVIGVDNASAIAASDKLEIEALYACAELHKALAVADVIVLTLPLNRETFNLIGHREFEVMKQGAFLVNVSRGPHVDRQALMEALAAGRLGGFAADVFWEEPASVNDSILTDRRTYFTPHVAGQSHEVLTQVAISIRQNVERLSNGQYLISVVNGVACAP